MAFVNLFVYIIRFPKLSTIQMDLSLLDVISGYFGRLELATGAKKSFPFVRDLAQCAHAVVARSQPGLLTADHDHEGPTIQSASDTAYESARLFTEPDGISADGQVDLDMVLDGASSEFPDSLAHVTSHIVDLDFSTHDPLLGFMDTDLSWGMLSAVPRTDTLVSGP